VKTIESQRRLEREINVERSKLIARKKSIGVGADSSDFRTFQKNSSEGSSIKKGDTVIVEN
jgi:hypothetical protein